MRSSIVLLLVAAGALWQCRRPPDEETIVRWVEQAVADCEQGRSRELLGRLAKNFQFDGRRPHPLQANRLVQYVLAHTQGKRFYYPRPQVSIAEDGERAEARFPFLLLGGGGGRSDQDAARWLAQIADKSRLMRASLQLERDGDNWLLVDVRVERFTGLEFRKVNLMSDY